MKKFCRVDAETATKMTLRKRSAPTTNKREQKLRKRKKVVTLPSLNICDLPTEILDKIIGHINIWHHNRIRATCRRLKDVNDTFVMHEFQKASIKHFHQDPNSETSAAFRVIKHATEVYVHSGLASTFCGCVLQMLRSSYRQPFCFRVAQVEKLLVKFYAAVTELLGDTSTQRWRLLYIITLMKLIKAFDKSIISSKAMPLHWRIVVQLKGAWLGVLWPHNVRPLNQSRHFCNVLVMLSQMLIANITKRSFKHVWECPSEMYVFGNDASNSCHLPTTIFTLTVYGSKKICNLFRSCLEDESEQFQWPAKWPNDQFTVNLYINSKEAVKWGCSKSQHMEFGPFSATHYDAGDIEESN